MALFEKIKEAKTIEEMAKLLSKIYDMGWEDRDRFWSLSTDEIIIDIMDTLTN